MKQKNIFVKEGGIGILGFCGFGQFLDQLFWFLYLKTVFFWFWHLFQVAGFSFITIRFSVNSSFSDFVINVVFSFFHLVSSFSVAK